MEMVAGAIMLGFAGILGLFVMLDSFFEGTNVFPIIIEWMIKIFLVVMVAATLITAVAMILA